jgi:hypothetical protein
MTIGSTVARSSYLCDGVTTVFPVPIQGYLAGDFTVILTTPAGVETTLVLNSDYGLVASGTLAPPAWTMTTLAATPFPAGDQLQVFINPLVEQQTQFVQGQAFPSLAVQTAFDRLTQMVQRVFDRISRMIGAPDGDNSPGMLLPTAALRALMYLAFDANGNVLLTAALPGTANTIASLGPILNPITAAEIALGYVPVNQQYPAGYVDRYATNTAPGTTDMSSAFSKAAQVAGRGGCKVRWGATFPYRLNSPVNCTLIRGVVFEDESSANASAGVPSVIIGHTGHGFDLATSVECSFRHMVPTNVAGTVPKTVFFCARNPAGSGAGIHRFEDIRVPTTATFNFIYYGYASEENTWINCEWYNNQPGSGLASCNATNPSGFTSSYVSIATGSQSNADHRFAYGNSLFNTGNSGSQNEVCIQIENLLNFTWRDGLLGCAHGLGTVQVLGSSATGNLSFDSSRGEPLGTQPLYGVVVSPSTTGVVHVSWTFNNMTADAPNELLHFVATNNPSIQNLNMKACTCTSGKLLSVSSMSDSIIETMQSSTVVGVAGGAVTNNVFMGARANVTLGGTFSGNLYVDNLGGGFGIDGDSFVSASTACTGALTTAISYTVRLGPSGKEVILELPSIVGTTTAAASFTLGVPLPVQFRPPANLRQPCIIEDSGGTLNQLGQIFVTASTGVVIVFKDIVGTGTWTNGQTGGLPALTEVKWGL